MHGYELIGALEEKSGGRWKPSSGSIYPALHRLEHRGFIVSTEGDDGKRRFELTDTGRERVAEQHQAGNHNPWDEHGLGDQGELRRAIAEMVGPAKQIGRFGSDGQTTAAVAAVKEATVKLYRVLADGVVGGTDADLDADDLDAGDESDD
jgi:DNA-binding PadR family transcriptional regulator